MLALTFALALVAADDAHPVAPEFPNDVTWLNTNKPLPLASLRGQVVLLDFWTYCCINCMHVIPELKALEEKFADAPFVVIGVHSGKFDNEKDAANIAAAIERNDLRHPVIVDSDYKVWDSFGVQAWPTLILIGPDGRVVGETTGEGHVDAIAHYIQATLDSSKAILGKHIAVGKPRPPDSPHALRFPGKVLATKDRLFVADTNHNRIIEASLTGQVLATFAGFNHPQGMSLDKDTLYVADTGAHLVRAIDLKTRAVSAVAGTGELGRTSGGEALKVPLASPWDVLAVAGTLYIANAGSHQLLALDLANKTIRIAAGSGREGHSDGRDIDDQSLAQTSGLATDGKTIYFVDSESSSVRRFDPKSGELGTIVGKGLFDFGDKDGSGDGVRLQHPLGITWDNGSLFIADTYNHKIKRIDPATREVKTVAGSKHGDAPSELFEPGGISAVAGTLYVADTNNSRIIALDEQSRVTRIVKLTGL